MNTVQLTNETSGGAFDIRWSRSSRKSKISAVENCEEKSFMVATSVHPGETVWASEDFIMVDLDNIVQFYNDRIKLELNKKERLLYVVQH